MIIALRHKWCAARLLVSEQLKLDMQITTSRNFVIVRELKSDRPGSW
jgi:hypothetical protein